VKKKKPSLAEIVSRNIRKARLEAGMTQKELADKAGFKVSYVARLETKPQNLSLGVLERLALALNLSPSALFADQGDGSNITARDLKFFSDLTKQLYQHFK
jgi:transcriptional regulator with XRE-family HTH domain